MRDIKIVVMGNEARDKVIKGVNVACNLVRMTLGPGGRNVLMEKDFRAPSMVNDGYTILLNLELKDEIENLGAHAVREAARRTNTLAGDGTTTTCILIQNIVEEAYKKLGKSESVLGLGGNSNMMKVKREIHQVEGEVIKMLKKMAVPVDIKDLATLKKVALTSCENEKFAEIVADVVKQTGVDGFIDVKEEYEQEIWPEITHGMRFAGKYASDMFISNPGKKIVKYKDVPTLVTNIDLENPLQCVRNNRSIFTSMFSSGQTRVIVLLAPKFSPVYLENCIKAFDQLGVLVLPIKIPALTDEQLEDIVAYSGGTFIDHRKGMSLENVTDEDFGWAGTIIASSDEVKLIKGSGDQVKIKERIKDLTEKMESEKTEMFKKKAQRRIASLAGGFAVIHVGGKSDTERKNDYLKIEDAVNSTKEAVREGIVQGGGIALKKISEKMKKNVLSEALKTPYNIIQENAGGNLKISDDIVDPVKVLRSALESACSIAGELVTMEAAMAREDNNMEKLEEVFNLATQK